MNTFQISKAYNGYGATCILLETFSAVIDCNVPAEYKIKCDLISIDISGLYVSQLEQR